MDPKERNERSDTSRTDTNSFAEMLLHGGEDIAEPHIYNARRRDERAARARQSILPRDELYDQVMNKSLRRPTPKNW